MRQEGSRTVAPLNEEPRWPEGYLAVLREAGAIEKQLPYYVAWVRRFFARYPGRRRRDLGRAEIEAFLLASSREKGITNWRLAQGRAVPFNKSVTCARIGAGTGGASARLAFRPKKWMAIPQDVSSARRAKGWRRVSA